MTLYDPTRADILMTAPMPSIDVFAETFNVHRLWEAHDKSALLSDIGPRVRGLAAGGRLPVNAELLDQLPALEIISNFGVGYERVDVKEALVRGLIVTNTPDVLTDEVADLAMGLLLATVREIPRAETFLREGQWSSGRFRLTASLRGRTVGIVGLGRIGKAIAKRCGGFDLEVAYHGRSRQPDVSYEYFDTLGGLARHCDVLIVAAPGGPETDRMINRNVLDLLGPKGIFINIARGSVVDEPALIEALRDGRILSAGLDVFPNEPSVSPDLLALPNAVLLPHVGSASAFTFAAMNDLVFKNLQVCLSGGKPLTPIPEMPSAE